MRSKLGERGQLVIPKPYRDRLGLRGGQMMEIREEHGRLIVTKSPAADAIDEVYGILRREGGDFPFASTDDFIREIRGGDPDFVDPDPPGT